MSPRLAFAIEAAHRAGRSTLAHFQTGAAVDLKADETPVTVADRGAERMIREMIAREFPNDAILGEEEGGDHSNPNRWVVDPIDGTKSFVSGVPLYGTLLAYEENFRPVVGVVYFPALGDLVYAELGSGAWWNGRACRTTERDHVKGAVLCCGGYKSMAQYGRDAAFNALAAEAMATRTWGDAYGHMLVATGRADAMIDPIVSRWDLSAVRIIVEEAGGRFTDFRGEDPFAGDAHKLEAISSNGPLHPALLEAFRQ